MAQQWLGAPAALPEDLSSDLSSHLYHQLGTHMWHIQREWRRGGVRECKLVAENFHLAVLWAQLQVLFSTGAALLWHPW